LNEHSFTSGIHRRFNKKKPVDCHAWKINDNFQGGVPDAYYDGPHSDLWIEYKFAKIPKRLTTEVTPDLSEQQKIWCERRYQNGGNVWIVIGTTEGAYIVPHDKWLLGTPDIRSHLISPAQLVDNILAAIT
jgi:hypothetical protein